MTNFDAHERPAPAPLHAASPGAPLPPADEEGARERWRRIGLRLGEIAETEVEKLRDIQSAEETRKTDITATIRAISQVVITSLRAMEMEDNYDRKSGGTQELDIAERKRLARERAQRIADEIDRRHAARRAALSDEAEASEE